MTEINPIKALEAAMDGFQVMPMVEAARIGDVFVTATGGLKTIGLEAITELKDGAMLANSGHFNVEIDINALEELSESQKELRPYVREYAFKDGRQIYLLGEGRLINLAAAEGHPASVMDMSFANQALCSEYMAKHASEMEVGVHDVPRDIDDEVGRLKLQSMGIAIDTLTDEQDTYLNSWESGT